MLEVRIPGEGEASQMKERPPDPAGKGELGVLPLAGGAPSTYSRRAAV